MNEALSAFAIVVFIYIGFAVVGLVVLWLIIRSAVFSALKAHTHWVHDKELYQFSPWP